MVRVSLSLGIIAVVAGLIAIGFGIPIQAFGLGNTLIIAGSTVFSAGLVVIALSLVLRAIDRLSQELRRPAALEPSGSHTSFEHQPVTPPAERPVAPPQSTPEWPPAPVAPPPREEMPYAERREPRRAPIPPRPGWQDEGAEPMPSVARPHGAPPPRFEREPMPAPPPEREASVRSRLQSRAERPPRAPAMERSPQAPEPEYRREPAMQGEQRDEGAREPRVDPYAPPERRRVFGWTRRRKEKREEAPTSAEREVEPEFGAPAGSEMGRVPPSSAESRDMRRAPARGAPPPPRERPAPLPPAPPPIPRAAAEQQAAEEAQPVEVLKQGTVDGMSYTLYTDGSIDAEFPDGRIRFNSIEDLRQHLEAQG